MTRNYGFHDNDERLPVGTSIALIIALDLALIVASVVIGTALLGLVGWR
jgi:hypothetical protein